MKKKTRLIIILLIIILILVCLSIYCVSKELEDPMLIVSENQINGVTDESHNDIDIDLEADSYLIIKSNNEPTFDTANVVYMYYFNDDKCIGLKAKWTFIDEETAQNQYESWKSITTIKNLIIDKNIVTFTEIDNAYYGETANYIQENISVGEKATFEKTTEKYEIENL